MRCSTGLETSKTASTSAIALLAMAKITMSLSVKSMVSLRCFVTTTRLGTRWCFSTQVRRRALLTTRRHLPTTHPLGRVFVPNLNPDVVVMKSAKDGVRFDASGPLNHARDRCIFVE